MSSLARSCHRQARGAQFGRQGRPLRQAQGAQGGDDLPEGGEPVRRALLAQGCRVASDSRNVDCGGWRPPDRSCGRSGKLSHGVLGSASRDSGDAQSAVARQACRKAALGGEMSARLRASVRSQPGQPIYRKRTWCQTMTPGVFFPGAQCFAGDRGPVAESRAVPPGDRNCRSFVCAVGFAVFPRPGRRFARRSVFSTPRRHSDFLRTSA